MKSNDELITEAYQMGFKAFGIETSAPHNNKEFMAIIPTCSFSNDSPIDQKCVKLRQDMYKAYINGWTSANLSRGHGDLMQDVDCPVYLNNKKIEGQWKK